MNDTPASLSPENVDELLSADLDGEFDAAARELGFEPAAVRSLIEERPGTAHRRAALARARDALAALPELDELLAARLRGQATRAGEQAARERRSEHGRRRQRLLAASGAVAAGLAIVAGLAVVVNRPDDTASSNDAASAPTTAQEIAPAPATGGAVDFGEVPDVQTLAARVSDQVPQPLGSDTAAPAESAPKATAQRNVGGFSADAGASVTVGRCVVTAQRLAGVTTAPVVYGVATLAGTPVTAHMFVKGPDRVLVVIDVDCNLVNLQVVTP